MQRTSALRASITNSTIAMSAASLACAVLVGLSALVRIPVPGTPVPITLQTFALLACAGMLGRWYALQMVGWYLALGALGAPFFAGSGGLDHMFGATGGYLVGFIAAGAMVGFASSRKQRLSKRIAIYLAAASAVYVPGLLWLKIFTSSPWRSVISMGLLPFIAVDLAKAAAASAVRRIKS